MKLLIVIVNWRTSDLVIDCLRSLEPQIGDVPSSRVVIADNASGDGSVEKITSAINANGWSPWASVIALPKNGGFAYGNNGAVAPALASDDKPELIYLLNPDTIALPGAVRELVTFMNAHPRCGIGGGRAENPDGSLRRSAFRFHTPVSELEGSVRVGAISRLLDRYVIAPPVPDVATQVEWVSGASMIVRREVFEQVGLLDERYFMYFEETDFCRRAVRAGWEVWYVPKSRIIHLVGQASGVTGAKRLAKRRPQYWFDSRRHYFLTHFGRFQTLVADLLWTSGYAVGNTLRVLRGKPREDPPCLWWDFVRYNVKAWSRLR